MSHAGKPRTVTVMRRMSLLAVLVAIPCWPVVAGLAATSRVASVPPDLEVTSATIKLQGADVLTGTAIVDNLGARRVKSTTAAVVWTSATSKGAVELARFKVPVLTRGQRATAHFRIKLAGSAAGSYQVVVCANVAAHVRGLGRKSHCHAAGTVKIGRSGARGSIGAKTGPLPAVVSVPAPAASAPPAGVTPPVATTPPVGATPPVGTTPPAITLAAPVNRSSINKRTPTFSGMAGTASGELPAIAVRIYQGSFASGIPLQTLTTTASGVGWSVAASGALADGTYTAQASQSDSEGNIATSASSFTIDTVAPLVKLSMPANASTTGGRPTFSGAAGTASGDSPTVSVRLYAGSAASGTPVQTLTAAAAGGTWSVAAASSLAEGTYTAQASQSDAAANVGTSTANSFTAVPEVTITSAPSGRVPTGPAEITFFSNLAGDTFQCSLDGGSYTACSSPDTLSSPAPGPHTFNVRTVSTGGVAGLDPASVSWDSVAPEISLCGAISHNETLSTEDAPVYVLACNITVEHGAALSVQPGIVLKADSGVSLAVNGSLQVTATASEPVTFTSIEDDSVGGDTNGDGRVTLPTPGDWGGIDVNGKGSASFVHTTLQYASTALKAAEDAEVTIHESSIRHSTVGISAITFVEATKVNWGSPSGPSPIGSGTPVQGEVLVTPWVGYVTPPKPPKPALPHAPDETTCKNVMFIGARGSGAAPQLPPAGHESYDETNELNNVGGGVREVEAGLQQTLQGESELKVRPVALRYPALSTSGLSIPQLVDDYEVLTPYLENIWEGVYTLEETLRIEEARCNSEKVVLTGYSAGALVIHLALGELAGSPLISPSRIAAVVLISDPARAGKEDVVKDGTASPAGDGIYTKIFGSPPIPAGLTGRTISLCDFHDLVCAPGIGSNEAVHGAYSRAEQEQLGNAAAQDVLDPP